MHVFISDTHMTDHEAGGSVSDAELVKLAEEVGRLAKRGNVTLVLLGDIIDFLRSPKWNECWDQYSHSAPWSVMNPHFTNFANNHPEKCALAIARDVSKRYSGFSQALEKLAESGRVKTVYVVGNHDYMLQVSVQLRREVCKFLSLSDRNKAEKPFPITYENEEASVYATHGNTYDPTNYHRFEEGYWAFGDAVVLRVVNRFTPEVCARLACTEATVIGQQAHQLDNIEPTSDVPVYVRWMADESLTTSHEQEAVLEVWSRIVT